MPIPWPTLSGTVYCKGVADDEALLKECVGSLERERVSNIQMTERGIKFFGKIPLIGVTFILPSYIGSGEICLEASSNGIGVWYRVSWRRVLGFSLVAVAVLFLLVLVLVPGERIPPYWSWMSFAVLAVLVGYLGARACVESFVRSCIKRAGGIPLRHAPKGPTPR